MKCFNLIKPLTEVTRIGFPLYGNASLSCIDFFHQKDPKFKLKHDVPKGFLSCKGKLMKDSDGFEYFFFLKIGINNLL